jgi:hypothetical protein
MINNRRVFVNNAKEQNSLTKKWYLHMMRNGAKTQRIVLHNDNR